MIWIQLAIVLVCAALWRAGGWDKAGWAGYRDTLIPIIIGLFYCFTLSWWAGILVCATLQIIRLGYGVPDATDTGSTLGRIFRSGWLTRAIAGLLYILVGMIPVVLIQHCYIGYISLSLVSCLVGGLLSYLKSPDYVIEPSIGAVVGCSVFLLRMPMS